MAWAAMPHEVTAGIKQLLGSPVVDAASQPGGFSEGLAARVRLANGRRVFIKATSALIRLPDGSRGHWHRHSEGQLVHVVSGRGYVGRRNEEPLAIDEGDTIWIEPDEEHWHGSAEGVELAQLAVSFGAITWLEPS